MPSLDNTITATRESIEFFSTLTYLLDLVSEITILTNRTPGTEQDVVVELDCLGIEYSQIIITADKAKYIIENGITVFFEDSHVNIVFTIVPRSEVKNVVSLIKAFSPRAFYTLEEVGHVEKGFLPPKNSNSFTKSLNYFKPFRKSK